MIECMEKNELKEKVLDYASKVFFYCVKRCNTRMDAEDLSQTILLKVIENIDKGARIENLDYYIWGVCKNQFNIYLRKTIKDRKNIEYIDDIDYSNESKTSLDEMIENEKIRKMKQAIKLLSKDYTEILYAYYVEDKTLKSIADELELPLGTVTWKLSKIREKLKEYLDMERLDGKKAYVPKYFTSSASYSGELPFNLHETVKHLFVKNLLWHTYDNVCSNEDLSIEMGMAKPYVEDVVNHLLERQFLIQEGNKYKSNVTFIGHDIIKKVDNCMKNYEHIYINEVLKFAKDNLKYYRSMVENKDIPDNLLMWSFLQVIFSYTYIPNITRTKKYNDVEWSFCLYENVKNYNRNDFYMSWNGFGDVEAHNIFGEAYPAGSECCEIIHPVHKRLLATSSINGENLDSYAMSRIAYDNLEYSKLDDIWKKEIDNGIKYNICKIENDVVKFIMPCIDIEDFRKLKTLIRNSENLKNTYFELWSKITKLVQNNIPNYLSEEAEFVAATLINPLRSHLMIIAYDNGLLGLDEEHEFFVYNAIIVKTK